MEVVSANTLAKRIVDEYFQTLDHDTQDDIFHFVRNFITTEQEKLIDKREIERENQVNLGSDSDSDNESETKCETGCETKREISCESIQEGDDFREMTPYDMEPVDIISVFLHTRALYEYFIKTPFVGFWDFYTDTCNKAQS